jgi:hypothetical protein
MATSVFSFKGTTTSSSDFKSADLEINFSPTSNIAEQLCYVECSSFTWRYNTAITGQQSRDMFIVSANWAQNVSGNVETYTRLGRAPLGTQMNNICYGTGPVLCFIPGECHSLRLTVTRADGGVVSTDGNGNILYVVLKIVPANSRQAPIGV